MEFFRRLLSTGMFIAPVFGSFSSHTYKYHYEMNDVVDRHPPFDLLLTNFEEIIPLILKLTEDHRYPVIQYEAAWCITNIACANAKHLQSLLAHGAVRRLMKVIYQSKEIVVQNQCLWAIFNISTEQDGCQQLLDLNTDMHCNCCNIQILLSLVDVEVLDDVHRSIRSSLTSVMHSPTNATKRDTCPYSAVMRQVAFILCNIIK